MLSVWRSTDEELTVEQRMGETYREAAVSITITSAIDIVTLLVATMSPTPGMQLLATYLAVGVCYTFIYQITFFGGCLALAGHREVQRIHPITCKKLIPLSEAGR